MNIYYNIPNAIDTSVIISIIALVSSWIALYFQFFWKTQRLTLNIFPHEANYLQPRNIAANTISLSNQGNTTILLAKINYQTVNDNTTATYQTNLSPDNLPML